ncbi:LysR family transcriptional regulator [Sneathiella marina]|uniref:LysR family transcriptional regulator n=1 Tax=Sneathiella marina TaxID=2950108 RepID=A0ABY4W338_9PROT|nr:LysR family transcriptional regulator [Sneathiella marina]USG61259.1 LysR family transcriptional regulator [Sneathiella marina]
MHSPDRLKYINFSQLRSFYAVGRVQSFTKAAVWLNIGQPTVTTQVKALEERFNVQLFDRSPNGLHLTDTGVALMKLARQIFALEEHAHSLLDSTGNSYGGKLHIGTVGSYFVMDFLVDYSEKFPLVQVSVVSGNSGVLYERLLNYELDVAILGRKYDDHKLEQLRLGAHEVAIIVDESHDWAAKSTISLEELDGQRMIFREEGSMTRRALEEKLEEQSVKPNVIMELSRDSVVEAVAAGLGAGIISMEEFSPDERLTLIRIRSQPPMTNSYAACLRERRNIPAIDVFMRLVEKRLLLDSSTNPVD